MIELRAFANNCSFHKQDGKYYIQADSKIIKQITKEDYGNYELLSKVFNEYLEEQWPSFWKNPFKYFGLHKLKH